MRGWLPLLIAVQFLTRLPVSLPRLPEPQESGRSLFWYPLVGLLIGILLVALHWLLSGSNPLLQAALLLAVWVWLSGALHLDGLADTADAWVGGHGDRERTLAIMKDPACGPMGVIALVLTLMLKFAVLTSLVSSSSAWLTLLLAPWVGRLLLPVLLISTPYARPGGLGQVLVDNAPPSLLRWLAVHALTISTMALVAWGALGLLPVLAVAIFTLYWRRVLIRRLGGTTGDTAGALLEMAETLFLLGFALQF